MSVIRDIVNKLDTKGCVQVERKIGNERVDGTATQVKTSAYAEGYLTTEAHVNTKAIVQRLGAREQTAHFSEGQFAIIAIAAILEVDIDIGIHTSR